MTTDEMKLALLKHFRYLNYPMVASECVMLIQEGLSCSGTFYADILAIKKDIIVEIEIKQYRCEMVRDLKTKLQKHAFYLRTKSPWDNCYDFWEKDTIRPHKFYFAYHLSPKNRKIHNATYYPDIPTPYGLIIVYIVKDFIRQKKRVRLGEDTIKLCQVAGFTFKEIYYRKIEHPSFWRILYQQKHPEVEKIDSEDILIFEKTPSPAAG